MTHSGFSFRFAILCCTALLSLGACAMTKDRHETPEINLPDTWKGTTQIDNKDTLENWWYRFDDKNLVALQERVLAHNIDLRIAMNRIDQSRAQARIANATLFPAIGLSGSAGHSVGDNTSSSTRYNVGAPISYEIDAWQRLGNTREAAHSRLQAARLDRETVAIIVATDTARHYFNILTLRERIRLTESSLKIFRDIGNIVQARMNEGAATGLEVAQQNTTIANAEANLATLEQQLAQAENALALLSGTTVQQADADFSNRIANLKIPDIAPTQPSTLLQRRPDIRAQEELLRASNADLAVARTAIFPSLTLGVTPSLASPSFSTPADFTVSMLASLTQRIFEGGRIQGEIDLADARKQEMIEHYRNTVLTAFRETEDALADMKAATSRENSLKRAMQESRTSYKIAYESYMNGATDFISLLDAQRSLLQAQDNYAQAMMARLTAATSLFKALGGGWQENAAK